MHADNHHNTAVLLVRLCNEQSFCPSAWHIGFNEASLFTLAVRNKLQYVLMHFIYCSQCSSGISQPFYRRIKHLETELVGRSLFYKSERATLIKILRKTKTVAALFKDFSSNITLKNSPLVFRSDLDVLVDSRVFPKLIKAYAEIGYDKKSLGIRKEVQLRNPKNHFEVDLHFLLAYPHRGDLTINEYNTVKQFTGDLLAFSSKTTERIVLQPIEYHMLSLIIRFWFNDMCLGLRNLRDISSMGEYVGSTHRWEKVFALASYYGILYETYFVLYLGSRLFNARLPRWVIKKISFRVKMLSAIISCQDVAVFPSIVRWHTRGNAEFVTVFYRRYFYLKSCLNQNTRHLAFMNPGAVVFMVVAFMKWLLICMIDFIRTVSI